MGLNNDLIITLERRGNTFANIIAGEDVPTNGIFVNITSSYALKPAY